MDLDSDDDLDFVNDGVDDFEMVESPAESAESDDDAPDRHQQKEAPADTPASTPPTALPRCRQKTLTCPYQGCNKAFNRQARLTEHLRSHTNDRPFTCPHPPCTKAFLRDSHLKHHIKSQHSDVRDYTCTWEGCSASFATGTRLRRHVAAHEAREKFRCRGYEGCDETFRKQETLNRHILSAHHGILPFPCPFIDPTSNKPCSKAYDTAEKLRTHQRSKHDPSKFTCSECLASNAEALTTSADTDPNSLPQATFFTYAELQSHNARVHPPTCPRCSLSFGTNKELTRHLELQHSVLSATPTTPAQTFPCTQCTKVFTKRGNLTVHVKTVHENRKDFVCGTTSIDLADISDEFTTEKELVLAGCGRGFTSKASLEEHVRTAHLGLESKRAGREKKRKAERSLTQSANSDAEWAANNKKKARKPRKDKGVARFSVVDSLTAAPKQSHVRGASPSATIPADPMDNVQENESGLMSGSMTMCGNKLYHNGSSYDFVSGEWPSTQQSTPTATTAAQLNEDVIDDDGHSPVHGDPLYFDHRLDYEVDDGFFGGFETDHVRADSRLDPRLFT